MHKLFLCSFIYTSVSTPFSLLLPCDKWTYHKSNTHTPVYPYMCSELLSLTLKTSLLSLSTVNRLKYLNIEYHLPYHHRSSRGVKRSKWKLPLHGQITYRYCLQTKLPNFLYSSNTTSLMRRANNNNRCKKEKTKCASIYCCFI